MSTYKLGQICLFILQTYQGLSRSIAGRTGLIIGINYVNVFKRRSTAPKFLHIVGFPTTYILSRAHLTTLELNES